MSYMFDEWPTVSYDVKKNGKPLELTNITLRFKINELLRNKNVVMYTYDVQDGERPDIIAYKYYNDATLDWVILLTNNIIDPQFEWPLDDQSFERYIRNKYGSLEAAKRTNHSYEQVLHFQSVNFDGTIVPEKKVIIDKESYDSANPTLRELGTFRAIDKYTHELELNQARSRIKILDKKYLSAIVSSYNDLITAASR